MIAADPRGNLDGLEACEFGGCVQQRELEESVTNVADKQPLAIRDAAVPYGSVSPLLVVGLARVVLAPGLDLELPAGRDDVGDQLLGHRCGCSGRRRLVTVDVLQIRAPLGRDGCGPRWPGAVGRHEASVPQSGHGHTPTVVTTLLSWATVLNPSKDLDLGERQRLPLCHTEILHGSSSPPDIHVASTDTDRAVAYLRLVLDQYQAVGDPDEVATASKKDQRRQAEAERISNAARRMHFHELTEGESAGSFMSHTHDDDEVGHQHDGRQAFPARADGGYWEETGPSLGTQPPAPVAANIARAAGKIASWPRTPDHMLMRWRIRLFCGHVVERTAHRDHTTVERAFTLSRCVECGLDPASIVAARPLGLVSEPPPPPNPTVQRREKAELDLERARREVARLEKELGIAPPED